MLQVHVIRENKQQTIQALQKKNFAQAEQVVEQVLALDQQRKDTQSQLDQHLAESNALAKSIGSLMKEGKKEEAEKQKARTAELKTLTKDLADTLSQLEEKLQQILYTIPNTPHSSVPVGKSGNCADSAAGEILCGTGRDEQLCARPLAKAGTSLSRIAPVWR